MGLSMPGKAQEAAVGFYPDCGAILGGGGGRGTLTSTNSKWTVSDDLRTRITSQASTGRHSPDHYISEAHSFPSPSPNLPPVQFSSSLSMFPHPLLNLDQPTLVEHQRNTENSDDAVSRYEDPQQLRGNSCWSLSWNTTSNESATKVFLKAVVNACELQHFEGLQFCLKLNSFSIGWLTAGPGKI